MAAACAALGLGYFLVRGPLQIGDSLDNLLELGRHSLADLFTNQLHQTGYMRPMLWVALKVAFDASGGSYFEMFKAIHVAQVLVLTVLFVRLVRVDTMEGALAVVFGLVVLIGNHTFAPMVIEGFPINHFLTVVICCLAVANLIFGAPSLRRDVTIAVLFVFATLTVETGLLVWVIVVAGWMTGCRGASRRTALLLTGVLLAYFVFRFSMLPAGTPPLVERSSGFGFRVLEPAEMAARFGSQPLVFYAYNVISHVCSVLFAEPKGGVWGLARGLVEGGLAPGMVIGALGSTCATLLVAGYAAVRRGQWIHWQFDDRDRLVVLFVAVLAANAVIGYPYTRNHIIAPAGTFHALAATVAAASALNALGRGLLARPAAVGLVVLLAMTATASSVRFAAVHYRLREAAWRNQNDWAHLGPTTEKWNVPEDPKGQQLVRKLHDESTAMRVPGTYFLPRWMDRYFEEFQ
jgi:hypothetical protein